MQNLSSCQKVTPRRNIEIETDNKIINKQGKGPVIIYRLGGGGGVGVFRGGSHGFFKTFRGDQP